jgi:hypothetical protein
MKSLTEYEVRLYSACFDTWEIVDGKFVRDLKAEKTGEETKEGEKSKTVGHPEQDKKMAEADAGAKVEDEQVNMETKDADEDWEIVELDK